MSPCMHRPGCQVHVYLHKCIQAQMHQSGICSHPVLPWLNHNAFSPNWSRCSPMRKHWPAVICPWLIHPLGMVQTNPRLSHTLLYWSAVLDVRGLDPLWPAIASLSTVLKDQLVENEFDGGRKWEEEGGIHSREDKQLSLLNSASGK